MVGHSLGALESLRFTDRHRRSVVGMVLVDPDIPDRAAAEKRLAPRLAGVWQAVEPGMQLREGCAAGLSSGTVKKGTSEFDRCTTAAGVPTALFPLQQATMTRLNADPARLLTQASLGKEHYASSQQVTDAKRNYGDLPLIVLTAGRADTAFLTTLSTLPAAMTSTPEDMVQLREEIARFIRDGWGAGHDAYAALSTRGRNQLVPDSGHNIMVEKPEVVIAAIAEVLREAREE
jgi:pimeloyl-ACP methyl ester carboxylesterase